jgi:hypothetical protein
MASELFADLNPACIVVHRERWRVCRGDHPNGLGPHAAGSLEGSGIAISTFEREHEEQL